MHASTFIPLQTDDIIDETAHELVQEVIEKLKNVSYL